MSRKILITGGVRSGKSRYALERACNSDSPRAFLATAEPLDEEMQLRIKSHQEERQGSFTTLEEPLYLGKKIRVAERLYSVILIDCVTLWINNLLYYFGQDHEKREKEAAEFLQSVCESPADLILVTNEIGLGIIPDNAASRQYVDQLGEMNRRLAGICDEVIFMVSGIPVPVPKVPGSQNAQNGIFLKSLNPVLLEGVPNPKWTERLKEIKALSGDWRLKAQKKFLEQTRPARSLGYLEDLVERVVAIQESDRPALDKKMVVIFASDHGVEKEGVSLYPRSVTQAMVYNFLNGGATISSLARWTGSDVQVVDIGVDGEFKPHSKLISAKIACGTKNMKEEPAMSAEELDRALEAGWERVRILKEQGVQLTGLGEMGIGNTTPASAVAAALLNLPVSAVTGRGTGIDDQALEHKARVIEASLRLHSGSFKDPWSIVRHVGGFDLAALMGSILSAAAHRVCVVIDGWIVTTAALAAYKVHPGVLDYLFFSHQSQELGHVLVLRALGAKPILDISMRLGEGSGAALAMGILEAGVRIYNEVATFEEAQVAQAKKVSTSGTVLTNGRLL